jgi:hypothetical protein
MKDYSEYVGKMFGHWLILSFVGKIDSIPIVMGKCTKCNITQKELNLYELRRNKSSMCNSCANKRQNAKDLSGQKFGKLTVIKRVENKGKRVIWECKCDCGDTVIKDTSELKSINDDKCHHNKSVGKSKNTYKIHKNYIIFHTNNGTEFIIDHEDFDKVIEFTWRNITHNYIIAQKNNEKILLHRLIMNPKENEVIDHINGNPLDNRKCNLRICTHQENSRNTKVNINNTSGHRGVYFSNGKWTAYITKDYKKKNLGRFNDIKDAINARIKAEIELFGEYSPAKSRNEFN